MPDRSVAALAALSVGTFSFVTCESLPIGLLPLMADDLHRSVSAVGLLVTGYGTVVVLASVPLTLLTRRAPRRPLLAGLLAVFVVSSAATALAPTYATVLGARLLTALSQALFWSIVAATAAGLFPPERRGRVMATLFSGSALGPVLGVPAGTWLGQHAGWRAAFGVLTALSLALCVLVTALLPGTTPYAAAADRGDAPDLRRYVVLLGVTALAVTGMFTAYTYAAPFLLDVTGFPRSALSVLFLASGAAGILGASVTGGLYDRRPRLALLLPVALECGVLAALWALGTSRLVTVAALVLSGAAGSSLAAATSTRALQVAPGRTDTASSGGSTAFNVGITLGSLLGGALVAGPGVRATPLAGSVLCLAALALLLLEPRLVGSPEPAGRAAEPVEERAG
ncbi:DHA1 family L-arabinose/isopropyl-beta-D-thiogalactopyranoside export protein-like MFS transporter/DHA1 family inner membrane transport protein [Motilibacter rhizosphaerae]|uniref:DHA1 family L-arabinose/isopropyl-beta-D-thiogalactopyranoside export protein-like MFS transporter/DHA1 family inner membrane transport protein n=1 Tax=Motilibacter rhizosphaerae TaxID=598652 RepID=A0A4Q7NSV8_9ACTN|nr:MFS transporter [Motilibacter rhizosphaerae]RZS90201.1 DHA1 family L-arabinose/isopropyl-beta-D-thiogalactopyranoside export protein-like MFS transporter/DHA1 family inner membrane transport protein [Motilibacter rhizosphaerae]